MEGGVPFNEANFQYIRFYYASQFFYNTVSVNQLTLVKSFKIYLYNANWKLQCLIYLPISEIPVTFSI